MSLCKINTRKLYRLGVGMEGGGGGSLKCDVKKKEMKAVTLG